MLSYIQAGKDEGATLLTGGGRPAHISAGYFVAPTVFTGVKPGMRVWREEIFGPVSVWGQALFGCLQRLWVSSRAYVFGGRKSSAL